MERPRPPRIIIEANQVLQQTGFDIECPEAVDYVEKDLLQDKKDKERVILLRRGTVLDLSFRVARTRDELENLGLRVARGEDGLDLNHDLFPTVLTNFHNALSENLGEKRVPLRISHRQLGFIWSLFRAGGAVHTSKNERRIVEREVREMLNKFSPDKHASLLSRLSKKLASSLFRQNKM